MTIDQEWKKETLDFEEFKRVYEVAVIGLTLKCSKCGNKWGISIWDEKTLSEVKTDKLACRECSKKEPEELEK